MITSDNISSHELIGLQTQVVKSDNEQIIGLKGKIIDETKFMFALSTVKGIKKLPKNSTLWRFEIDGQQVELDGARLTRRSYERIGDMS